MKDPGRILIYRCGAIGDTIVSIPAMRVIRAHHPAARFILMTASGGESIVWTDRVLNEFGWFDEVITYEAHELRNPVLGWKLRARVRAAAPDLVYYLASARNSAIKVHRDRLFFLLAGVSRFVATSTERVNVWGRLRRDPRLYPNETDRLLSELRRQGLPDGEVPFDLPLGPAHAAKVDETLSAGGLDLSRPLVAMCPGSKQKIKIWPEERFAEIGRQLIEDEGVNIAIVGGADETAVGERIQGSWPEGRSVNLAQKLSILESSELLRRCLFYVGNDTGAMHLAAAVGTRCVAIFSAREPARSWHPYGDNHAILRKSVPCQNCYLSECVTERLRCLTGITVEEVLAACRRTMVYR